MLFAILAAWSADVAVSGKPFRDVTALAGMSPELPGVLQIGLLDRTTTCEQIKSSKPPKKVRVVLLSFDGTEPGALAATPEVMAGDKFTDADWSGGATLITMPSANGGTGRLSLGLDGATSHAHGELTFTLCTDIVPWVAPSSDWPVTTIGLPGLFADASTPDNPVYEPEVPVRMPFPIEWTDRMTPRWVLREAQDGRTTWSVDYGTPPQDAAVEFQGWADSQLATWPDAEVQRREYADGVGVIVFTRRYNDDVTLQMDAHVTRPGAAWMITCNLTTIPRAADLVDEAIRACKAAELVPTP